MRPRFAHIFAGSLLAQDGEEHTHTRRLLTPAFKLDALRAYLPRIHRMARAELLHWTASPSVDLQAGIKQLTLRIAFTLLLGADIPEDEYEFSPGLLSRYQDLLRGFMPWPFSRWDSTDRSKEAKLRIQQDVEKIIRKRMALLDEGYEPKEIDPLWLLMKSTDEEGNRYEKSVLQRPKLKSITNLDLLCRLPVNELALHAVLLVVAGHETTAATIASFIATCLQNPALVDTLRQEQDELAAACQDKPFTPNQEDLRNMHRLQETFREVERMYPVAMQITRKTAKDLIYLEDGHNPVVIPEGSYVAFDILSTNRDPATYTNPDTFDPSRWSKSARADSAEKPISNFSLATFGAGHRHCLGMQFARLEMGIIGSMLIREFEWNKLEGIRLERVPLPTFRWRDGLWVNLRQRELMM
ncbi:hypothetical protein SpCBS45565_g00573 [Spizellomyces sp. 'palustris']|nr:hypothetical protein SpCBS45565_g00573 [Spizellomyces sp. 'palustris']